MNKKTELVNFGSEYLSILITNRLKLFLHSGPVLYLNKNSLHLICNRSWARKEEQNMTQLYKDYFWKVIINFDKCHEVIFLVQILSQISIFFYYYYCCSAFSLWNMPSIMKAFFKGVLSSHIRAIHMPCQANINKIFNSWFKRKTSSRSNVKTQL